MAALTSRFNKVLQELQVQSRSCIFNSLLMFPQQEQVLLDGSNVPISKIFTPYHPALYFKNSTNLPHPTSLIDCANLWFLSILATCKVSIAIDWFSLINCVETLCKKSFRWLATFSCSNANFCFVLLPLYFENLRCKYFNFDKDCFRNLGLSNSLPSDETIKDLIPKSIPTVVFSLTTFGFLFSSLVSHNIETKYLLVGVLVIVACLITPFIGRCKISLIPSLNFGIINFLSKNVIFCGILKLPVFDFFLNLGKFDCPLKKRVKEMSKFLIDCCKDWLLISFNHAHSFLRSGNWFIKSKQLRLILLPAYAICLVSKARLYINLLLPMCLFISSHCVSVGNNRYLKDFNTNQKYNILHIKSIFFKKLTKRGSLILFSKN